MSLPPLAELADYELRHGPVAEPDRAGVAAALADASGLIRAVTGQRIDRVTDDTARLAGDGSLTLVLPERPVLAVTAVTTVRGRPIRHWRRAGHLVLLPRHHRPPREGYLVTYTHGHDPLPDDLVGVVVAMAHRRVVHPGGIGLRNETIGSYARSLAGTAAELAGAPTAAEQAVLRRYSPRLHAPTITGAP